MFGKAVQDAPGVGGWGSGRPGRQAWREASGLHRKGEGIVEVCAGMGDGDGW